MQDVSVSSPVRVRRPIGLAAAILAVAFTLAGCGGTSAAKPDVAAPAGASTAVPAGSGPAAVKATIGKRTGNCGDAKLAINVVVNAAPDITNDVTDIDADPTCTELILSTALDRAAGAQAQKLCEAVAKAAFANGFSTVTVRAVGQGHVTAGNFVRAIDGGACTKV
jgi:predicted small secreted protein